MSNKSSRASSKDKHVSFDDLVNTPKNNNSKGTTPTKKGSDDSNLILYHDSKKSKRDLQTKPSITSDNDLENPSLYYDAKTGHVRSPD